MTDRNKKLASFILIFVALVWGASFILIKKALLVYSPVQVALARIFFAYIVLVPSAVMYFKKYFKQNGWQLAFSGIIGNLIPAFLFAKAQTQLASGIAGVLNSLTPLFTLLIGIYFFKNKIIRGHVIGILFGLAGSVGLSLINPRGELGSINVYAWLVIVASFCYALNVNFIKKYLGEIQAVRLTALALFFVGPPSLIYLLTTDFLKITTSHSDGWLALGYLAFLGIVNTALALVLFFRLLQMTSPVAASSVTYVIPVIALLFGVMDGETIFFMHIIGMFLIIIGVYLVNRRIPENV
ncbi:MAG: DMT family transporter [Calditrichae bacterium]|nr:DMT family transporter [Calditrichota bacterium]MCB9057741.1 DMT family transporter [Calditrichia bacterium]